MIFWLPDGNKFKVFLFYSEPHWVTNISYIEQLLNEVEYDVKNYADREGACHQLGNAYIGLHGNRVSGVRI